MKVDSPEDRRDKLFARLNKLDLIKSNTKFPPILDRDPVIAANFLTIEDSEKVLVQLMETYKSFRMPSQKHKALEINICLSKEHFDWFAQFSLELDKVVRGAALINIPFDKAEDLPNTSGPLSFFPPISFKTSKKYAIPKKYKVKEYDPINWWRINYIQHQYDPEDFRGGYPAWYILKDITLFEDYCPKTNRRVRIDFHNGEFFYYIAGASDNWRRILAVPLEMDSVVAALLFKE